MKKTGIYPIVRKQLTKPYQYDKLILNHVFIGGISCYDNGKRLWNEWSKTKNVCRNHAIKEANTMLREYFITNKEIMP